MKKVMMLKIYITEDELGDCISIDGIIDGKDYSLGSMDIEEYPRTLHEAIMLPELKVLGLMEQLTELERN
jgi:hypothetical protein